ncbi:MAG: glycosyltransferase family A protein [Patescibacteria group bacterium]|jgi:GT2 family glycosyltransferase
MTAVIIVSFGRAELLKHTLDSLLNSNYDPAQVSITVVDNGSQPEVVSLLTHYRPQIHNLVLLRNNRGKPYAWNLGARVAQEQCDAVQIPSIDYFLFCDSDLDFKLGWHETLTTAYKEHQNLPLCGLSGMRWPSHKLDALQTGPTTQINVVRFPPGCCILMSAEAYRRNGPWDTKRLIRTVDTCYFRNAFARGWKNASIHPNSVIDHTGRTSRTWHIQTGKPKLLP